MIDKHWLCPSCLRRDLCICIDSTDTTVVDVPLPDDEPTVVYVRRRRETLNGYRVGEMRGAQ